jgi:hypothetical protein
MEGYFQEPLSSPTNPIRTNYTFAIRHILLAQEY